MSIKTENAALVLPSDKDKFLAKLQSVEQDNLTAEQQKRLKKNKQVFCNSFLGLAYSFQGLSTEQIREFNDNELRILDEIITKKARPWAVAQIIAVFPLVGDDCKCFDYFFSRRWLKKKCGENWFSDELIEKIKLK